MVSLQPINQASFAPGKPSLGGSIPGGELSLSSGPAAGASGNNGRLSAGGNPVPVPRFDDHDLCGTQDTAQRAYKAALSDFNPSSDQLAAATEAMAIYGKAQLYIDQLKQGKQP